jgi:hypothetical protein
MSMVGRLIMRVFLSMSGKKEEKRLWVDESGLHKEEKDG